MTDEHMSTLRLFAKLPARPHRSLRGLGFTLVEVVIVIIILSVIATIAAKVIKGGFDAYYTGQDITQADWQGRVAMERITRELREVRDRTSLTGSLTASDSRLDFTDIYGTAITYQLSGTTLNRTALPGTTQPLAGDIASAVFSYYTSSGVATTTSATVYTITLDMTVTTPSSNTRYRTTVRPRSFQ